MPKSAGTRQTDEFMANRSDLIGDDYRASDDYYARRDRRNARDLDRVIDACGYASNYLGLTGLWRRFSNWVAGPA